MRPDNNRKALRGIARSVASAAMRLFGLSIMRGVTVLSADVGNTGYVLLESGIEKFAMLHDLDIETEPAEDENGPFAFMVARMDGIEILQIDETYTPEDAE